MITILRKREDFRSAFNNFNYQKVANYTNEKLEDLRQDTAIIRNRLKIKAAKKNAIAFIEVQKNFGSFSKYIWEFVDGNPIQNNFTRMREIPANSPLSETTSKDLKSRGVKFVGPTIVYAYMQAMGMANNHITDFF